MSPPSLQRIEGMLNVYPFNVQLVQELKLTYHQIRLAYSIHIQELVRQEHFIHNLIIFTFT